MKEIEHKFLPNELFDIEEIKKISKSTSEIRQAYVAESDSFVYRIRESIDFNYETQEKTEKYTFTIKERTSGEERIEIEKDLTAEEFQALFQKETKIIEKTRYSIVYNDSYTWEIDVFHGKHEGLVLIEIELKNKNDTYVKPHWIGENVTKHKEYYNHSLINKAT